MRPPGVRKRPEPAQLPLAGAEHCAEPSVPSCTLMRAMHLVVYYWSCWPTLINRLLSLSTHLINNKLMSVLAAVWFYVVQNEIVVCSAALAESLSKRHSDSHNSLPCFFSVPSLPLPARWDALTHQALRSARWPAACCPSAWTAGTLFAWSAAQRQTAAPLQHLPAQQPSLSSRCAGRTGRSRRQRLRART